MIFVTFAFERQVCKMIEEVVECEKRRRREREKKNRGDAIRAHRDEKGLASFQGQTADPWIRTIESCRGSMRYDSLLLVHICFHFFFFLYIYIHIYRRTRSLDRGGAGDRRSRGRACCVSIRFATIDFVRCSGRRDLAVVTRKRKKKEKNAVGCVALRVPVRAILVKGSKCR